MVFIVALFVSYFRLNESYLGNWDESFYADGIRHIIRTGDIVVPYWNKEIFLDKPPLHLWTATLGRMLVGESSAGYRFSSATSVFLTIVLAFYYARSRYNLAAALTVVLVLAVNSLFLWRGRAGNTDGLLTLLVFLVFWVSQLNLKYKYPLLGILLSLVYLDKSTVVLFPILSLGILEIHSIFTTYKTIDWRQRMIDYFLGAVMFIALPSLWLWAGYQRLGFNFINFYVLHSDYDAAGVALKFFSFLYPRALINSLGVFSLLVAGGGLLALRNYKQLDRLALLAFSLPLVIGLMFSPVHYHWYLLPSLPIFALLAGYLVYEITQARPARYWLILLCIAMVAGAGWQFKTRIWKLFYDNAAYHQARSGLWLADNTLPTEEIVRLDDVYPTLIYYSDRRILISAPNSQTKSYFVSRADLLTGLVSGKYDWLNGKKTDVKILAAQLPTNRYRIYEITSDESVLEMTP